MAEADGVKELLSSIPLLESVIGTIEGKASLAARFGATYARYRTKVPRYGQLLSPCCCMSPFPQHSQGTARNPNATQYTGDPTALV
jgi:hypothetical protein